MRRIEINKWNGQFNSPKVIHRIRRIIASVMRQKQCVLVDFENVRDMSEEEFRQIAGGWPEGSVKIIGCQYTKWLSKLRNDV